MTYLRKQVIQDGKIVYQDFGDAQSSPIPASQPPGNYPAYNDYPGYQQPASFPPPVPQPPAAPPVIPANTVQQETEIVTSAIYVHPFVWLFGLVFFAVCMVGLLRPAAVFVPYGGGGNTYIMPGSGGQ